MRPTDSKHPGFWILNLGSIVLLLFLSSCSAKDPVPVLVEKARQGNAGAGGDLVQAMGSPDRTAALEAYTAILGLGSVASPWLVQGLESGDEAVVEASAAALGNLGDRTSVAALLGILQTSGRPRHAAAWALGEIGDPLAIEPLVRSLGEEDASLRKEAVRALVKFGSLSVPAVLPFLRQTGDPRSRRAAIRVLGEVRAGEAVGTLAAVTGENRDVAVWALGRTGGEGALQPVLSALSDPRWRVRREAAEALGNIEDDRAVPALKAALEDDAVVVREWAARSLETITGEQVLYLGEDGEMVPPYNLYR